MERPIWTKISDFGTFFRIAPYSAACKKIQRLMEKYITLRQLDHNSASFCALDPKNAVPRSISKKCMLAFLWKSTSRVGNFQRNAKTHFFEVDLGTALFGSSAQNYAELWSSCCKLIYFCMSFLSLKLAIKSPDVEENF